MKDKTAIRQLEDLRDHCHDMTKNAEDGAPWEKDVEALTIAIEAIRENKILKHIEKKESKENEKLTLALFGAIRNNTVMPIGLKKGKSLQEINEMAVDTLHELINGDVIDWDRMRKSFEEGGGFKEDDDDF